MLIHLRYGNTNSYLIRGTAGSVLVDTDFAGTLPAFYRALKAENLRVSDITHVLATHYHPDHMGLVSELMAQGVKFILLPSQIEHVHFSDAIFAKTLPQAVPPIDVSQAQLLRFEDSRAFLKTLGIEGEIIATPSHSPDSISVILDEGTTLVGDLEPCEYLAAYDDNQTLQADWDHVLSYHPKRICYAHANEKHL